MEERVTQVMTKLEIYNFILLRAAYIFLAWNVKQNNIFKYTKPGK